MMQPDEQLPPWLSRVTGSAWLLPVVFVAALLEAVILPIPLELLLIPLMLVERARLWSLAATALAGCLSGALLGYGLGAWLFDSLGQPLLEVLNGQQAFDAFSRELSNDGFMAIVMVGITPVPFQVAMLAAGAVGYSLGLFMLASAIGRGIRYFGLAWLVRLTGERALALWRRHARKLGMVLLGLALLGYGLSRWLGA
ncbi:VTT domain-containing protein [Oceanimonas sp. CHS3-5]|uniref:YqaA family protein n=1 Tax=Oceanimonas sp. CHS3-5 TaxID=3068186 RepID=UPI00273E3D37|nr:VTT domain-containing protein [Oceanimonas sp. CHS3-5]MDP5290791.1 VTT domain-containing protein [Oceanimonas sp. CHS3-5]